MDIQGPLQVGVVEPPPQENYELHITFADAFKAAVLARLKRVEGQIRGLQRMVESDTYCIDVLTQVSAATRALDSVALLMLDDHLHHCVANGSSRAATSAASLTSFSRTSSSSCSYSSRR